MKKLVLLFTIVLFTMGSALAQQGQGQRERATPEERAKRQTETLTKELGLNKEQKDKIYKIVLKYSQPRKQENADTSREKRREEFQKIQKERNDSIKSVLTNDQKVKFDKHLKDMQERMKEGQNRRSR